MTVACDGCGAHYSALDGPIHAYMSSSPACFAAFNTLLAAEYSAVELKQTHRLTVDTWAVQHSGDRGERRAIQSVGLHLARLMLQLEYERPPAETNAVMLDFSRHKSSLVRLAPPEAFTLTAADVAPFAGSTTHRQRVRAWAAATWSDWTEHHAYIREWVSQHSTRAW